MKFPRAVSRAPRGSHLSVHWGSLGPRLRSLTTVGFRKGRSPALVGVHASAVRVSPLSAFPSRSFASFQSGSRQLVSRSFWLLQPSSLRLLYGLSTIQESWLGSLLLRRSLCSLLSLFAHLCCSVTSLL